MSSKLIVQYSSQNENKVKSPVKFELKNINNNIK